MKVGFIGLGTMGASMATNLQKAGHKLVVHDMQRQNASHHLQAGAEWAATPQGRGRGLRGRVPLPAGAARGRGRGARRGRPDRRLQEGLGLLRPHHQLADAGAQDRQDLRREGPAHARCARERRARRRQVRQARDLGRRRQGRVRQVQVRARRLQRRGALHRPDRRRLGRQARAQLRGLRHPDGARRGVRAGRQGWRRAAGAVGGGARPAPSAAAAPSTGSSTSSCPTSTTRRRLRCGWPTRTSRSPPSSGASSACPCAWPS